MDSDSDFSDSDYEDNSMLDYDYIFVDIQGFKTYRNHFICKEFCIIDTEYTFHTLVKSPYTFNKMLPHYKRQAFWLTNFFHGLKYESGDTSIIEVKEKLYKRLGDRKIAVKGSEKIEWLQTMFRDCCEIECVNFDDLDYDPILQSHVSHKICNYHNDINLKFPQCALANTLSMQAIATENRKKYVKKKSRTLK